MMKRKIMVIMITMTIMTVMKSYSNSENQIKKTIATNKTKARGSINYIKSHPASRRDGRTYEWA